MLWIDRHHVDAILIWILPQVFIGHSFLILSRVDYKQVLLQIERLYFILLEVEALKLKLSAIPTGAPLREQVIQHFNFLKAKLWLFLSMYYCLIYSRIRAFIYIG